MWNVAFSELRKFRRPTLFLGTMGAVVFFSALFSSLLFLLIDSPEGNSDRGRVISRDVLGLATGGVQGFSSVADFSESSRSAYLLHRRHRNTHTERCAIF